MIRSLVGRLTLLAQISALVVIVAFGISSLWLTAHVFKAERRAFVAESARRLAKSFDDELAEESDTLLAAQGVVEDAADVGVLAEVRNAAGHLLGASRAPRAHGTTGAKSGDDDAADERFVSYATTRTGARIRVEAPIPWLQQSLRTLERSLLLAAIPILLLGLLLGRLLVARAMRPLSAMAEGAEGLSLERGARSLGVRSGPEEIDRLAASFDRLLARLDDAIKAERRLTADASHELRTPLTVLSGELEMLRGQVPAASPAALGLERATEQVTAMRELVEAILLLHRSGEHGYPDSHEFELLNLGDLTREALAEARLRHPGRDGDVTLLAPDEVLVRGDTALLGSALRNLLDNALKFTRPGERVRVEVSEAGGDAAVAVDDQGPGVPEGERERIFDPFFRGAEARAGASGFGLGLPILRRVAAAHGGTVVVERSPLGGARFVLRLPAPLRSRPEARGAGAGA